MYKLFYKCKLNSIHIFSDLKLGELIHDDTFSLYEAMSAIEMMDPKMDAGMLCNRGIHQIKSFDQAVEDNILKLNNFDDKEIIGIIDSTYACLATWLEGHSLAKTVFINLYLHKPYQIEDKILKVILFQNIYYRVKTKFINKKIRHIYEKFFYKP